MRRTRLGRLRGTLSAILIAIGTFIGGVKIVLDVLGRGDVLITLSKSLPDALRFLVHPVSFAIFFVFCIAAGFFLLWHSTRQKEVDRPLILGPRGEVLEEAKLPVSRVAVVGLLAGVLLAIGVGLFLWKNPFQQANNDLAKNPPAEAKPSTPLPNQEGTTTKTLHDFFTTDFIQSYSKIVGEQYLTFKDGSSIRIEFNLYFDVPTKTQFVAYYIPESPLTHRACEYLSKEYKETLSLLEKRFAIEWGSQGERPMESKGIRFTGRVFLYHESSLFASETDALRKLYNARGLDPQFRGASYVLNANK